MEIFFSPSECGVVVGDPVPRWSSLVTVDALMMSADLLGGFQSQGRNRVEMMKNGLQAIPVTH